MAWSKNHSVCWLLYVLATSHVKSGQVLICTNILIYSARRYPNPLSHIILTEPTSPCPILIMSIVWLGRDKYQLLSYQFDSTRVWSCEVQIPRSPKMGDGPTTHSGHPVWLRGRKPFGNTTLSLLYSQCSRRVMLLLLQLLVLRRSHLTSSEVTHHYIHL